MGVSMAPQDPYFNVMNLVNQLNPNPDPNQMDAVAKMAQNQPVAPTGASGQIIDNLKRNEVQAVIQDLIEFKRMRDTGKLPAGFKPSPEQMQKFHQEVAPHLTTEEFGSVINMYQDTVSPKGPGSEEGSTPQPQQPQQPSPTGPSGSVPIPAAAQNPLLSQMLRQNAGFQQSAGSINPMNASMLQQPMSPEERAAPPMNASEEEQPGPASAAPPSNIPPMPGWQEVLIAALGSMGHPAPNQGELLSEAMGSKVNAHLKGVEIANEADARRMANETSRLNAKKERSQLVKVRNPKGELEQIWLQVGQPLPPGYKPDESEKTPQIINVGKGKSGKARYGWVTPGSTKVTLMPDGWEPVSTTNTIIRAETMGMRPIPGMPPGWYLDSYGRKVWSPDMFEGGGSSGQVPPETPGAIPGATPGKSPAIPGAPSAATPEGYIPGATGFGKFADISAAWQAQKSAIKVSNSVRIKALVSAGQALFDGTKDKDGNVLIEPVLKRLSDLRHQMDEGGPGFFESWAEHVQTLTSWDQFIKWETSDPTMAELKSSAIASAENMAMIYQGGTGATSDLKLKLAQSLLKPTLSAEAFDAVITGHSKDLMNKINRFSSVTAFKLGAEPLYQGGFSLDNTPPPPPVVNKPSMGKVEWIKLAKKKNPLSSNEELGQAYDQKFGAPVAPVKKK